MYRPQRYVPFFFLFLFLFQPLADGGRQWCHASGDAHPRVGQAPVFVVHFFGAEVQAAQGGEGAVDAVHRLQRQRPVGVGGVQLGYGAAVYAQGLGKLSVGNQPPPFLISSISYAAVLIHGLSFLFVVGLCMVPDKLSMEHGFVVFCK